MLSVNWFATVSNDAAEHAGTAAWTAENTIVAGADNASADVSSSVYDWIVQFNTASLANVASVADTASLLLGADGIDFEVLQGLGLAGMVLVRSSGASPSAVEEYFNRLTCVSAYEQDAYHAADAATSSATTSAAAALSSIDAAAAWNVTTGSAGVVVAVIDTGVDYTHAALSSYIWVNPGEIAGNGVDDDGNGLVDDVYGYDFANNDGDPLDDNGHGTHVSGIITSVAECSIMCLKFMNGDGSGYLSDAIEAINYATMMRETYGVNVRVDNNSWGGASFSSAMQTAIQAANSAGILFVVAAGNSGANNDSTAQYPADYNSPNIVVVAAATAGGKLASFSNYGATTVDLAAPGVTIYSTLPGNRYGCYSGTSMAAPYVSAVAALAWALDPGATVADVRSALLKGVDDSASLSAKLVSGGTLNAYNTLKLIASGQTLTDTLIESTVTPDFTDSVGLYNSATAVVYLNDDNNSATNAAFACDADGDWVTVVGDWDGDGTDTVGFYDPSTSTFYLLSSNESDAVVTVFVFGAAGRGWTPIAGDWDGDGIDTVGLYDSTTATFYLRNSNSAGTADATFVFGKANKGWEPIAGDWDGDGVDTVGMYNPQKSKFFLRNSNSAGAADSAFRYGSAGRGWTPIVGNWAGAASSLAAEMAAEPTPEALAVPADNAPASIQAKMAWIDLAISELLKSHSAQVGPGDSRPCDAAATVAEALEETVRSTSDRRETSAAEDHVWRLLGDCSDEGRLSRQNTAPWDAVDQSTVTVAARPTASIAGERWALDELFDLLGRLIDRA